MIKQFVKSLKYKGELGYNVAKLITSLNRFLDGQYLDDKTFLTKRFLTYHGYKINWDNPKSLNEKLQFLKFQFNQDLHRIVSDKYAARNFIKERFGEEYLIPLVFETKNSKEISEKIIPDYPVIVKANHDAGNNFIIRDKSLVDWKKLQIDCRWWLSWNYY